MIILLIATASAPISCTTQLQIRTLHKEHPSIGVMMQEEQLARMEKPVVRDTVREESDVMNAVLDENGEMKPIDVLDAAFVVARHKQVSERHGTVELDFEIVVPEIMLNTAWQVRITPVLTILNDKEQLDSILISGKDYKRRQQNGYEKYEKYLKSLLPLNEEELFLYRRSLKLFLERYAAAPFGVTEEEAVKHYTKNWLKRLNLIRHSRVGKKYERFVKSPYINGGVRIDTIIDKSEGNIHYRYRQLINTTPKMRRIDMNLRSSIETDGSILYSNLSKDTTKFYISSISSLADNREKYIGTDENWEKAENAIIVAAEKKGLKTVVVKGEAAFYGPKLDFMVKDAIGRRWQLGTIQVDYNLPERFQLEYIDSDGSRKRPVMIHRAPFGSIERFTAVVLEHTAGHLPVWLAPDQVKILPISEKYADYAEKVCELLKNSEIRASVDSRNETLGKRIRDIALYRVPLLAIVGEKEVGENAVSVRHEGVDKGSMGVGQFVDYIKSVVADELKI